MRTQKEYFFGGQISYLASTIADRLANTCLMHSGNRSVSVRDWNVLSGFGNDFPDDAVNFLYNSPPIKFCQVFI